MIEPRRVLVVSAMARGLGGGHLSRSLSLVLGLRKSGVAAFLFFDPSCGRSAAEVLAVAGSSDPSILYSEDPAASAWTCIVLDFFRTPAAEARRWAALGPLVGIDEGGPSRSSFDYLIDLLPGLKGRSGPNILDPGLLCLPERRRASLFDPSSPPPYRVLVSFGAEDPACLTLPAVRSLAAVRGLSVDALLGPLSAEKRTTAEAAIAASGARALRPEPNLKERLADYDLVVTSYGLTAYEAARARSCVLLVSPTRYHERLARARGFVSAGVGRAAAARVGPFLASGAYKGRGGRESRNGLKESLSLLAERTASAAPRESEGHTSESAATLLSSFSFPGRARCPLCGERGAASGDSRVLARFSDRTYRRCPTCGMLHMIRIAEPPIVYARDYFFDGYKKQYGKTYLEDFPQLERAGSARIRRVRELIARGARGADRDAPAEEGTGTRERKPRILDIGCAYGPFLAAARSAGFDCFGVDPAEDAVRFVRDELGIRASVGTFPSFDAVAAFGGTSFDAVSLWYVIEHFAELGAALEAASSSLRTGGVLAFSTPSASGISSRARFMDFLEKSPADHWTIWEPGRTARLLERFGFSLEKIVYTGHHGERFPGLARSRSDGLPRRLVEAASRAFGLGDTFEAYAVKK